MEKSLSHVFESCGISILLRIEMFTTHGPLSSRQASACTERSNMPPLERSFTVYLHKIQLKSNIKVKQKLNGKNIVILNQNIHSLSFLKETCRFNYILN